MDGRMDGMDKVGGVVGMPGFALALLRKYAVGELDGTGRYALRLALADLEECWLDEFSHVQLRLREALDTVQRLERRCGEADELAAAQSDELTQLVARVRALEERWKEEKTQETKATRESLSPICATTDASAPGAQPTSNGTAPMESLPGASSTGDGDNGRRASAVGGRSNRGGDDDFLAGMGNGKAKRSASGVGKPSPSASGVSG